METDHAIKGENSIKLKIDSFDGRQFNFFSALVTIFIGLVLLVAANTPAALNTMEKAPSECFSPIYQKLGYNCAPFDVVNNRIMGVKISQISSHKFVILQISPLQTKFGQRTTITVPVEVSAYALPSAQEDLQNPIVWKERKDLVFECSFSQYAPCNSEQVIKIEDLSENDHYIVINFLEINGEIHDFQLEAITLNQYYKYYFLIVKFIFLSCAIGLHLWRSIKLQKLDRMFYSPEHKALKLITPLLIILNLPFDGHLFESFILKVIMITAAIFLSAVLCWVWFNLIYQIAGFESSVIEQSSKFIKYFLIVYGVVAWFTYIMFGTSILTNPLNSFTTMNNNFFNLLKFSLYLALVAGVGWSAMKIANIMKKLNELSDHENRFFWFSIVFIVFLFYLIATGGLYYLNLDGTKFLLFSGLSTVYASAVCYLFIPTEEGLNQAQYIKKYDNPEAKDAYKDLEMSDEAPKREAHHEENFETYHHLNQQTGQTKNEIEGSYPFESKREDEEL